MTGKRSGGSVQPVGATGESQASRQGASPQAGAQKGAEGGGMQEGVSDDLQRVIDDAQTWIRHQMESNPYQTVLAAAGAGYLLGRGFASPIGKALILGAGRIALMNAWNNGSLRESVDRMLGQRSSA